MIVVAACLIAGYLLLLALYCRTNRHIDARRRALDELDARLQLRLRDAKNLDSDLTLREREIAKVERIINDVQLGNVPAAELVACQRLIASAVRDGGGTQEEFERTLAFVMRNAGHKVGDMLDLEDTRRLRHHTVLWCGARLHKLFLQRAVVQGRAIDERTAALCHAAAGLVTALSPDPETGSRVLDVMAEPIRGNRRGDAMVWKPEDGEALLERAINWAVKKMQALTPEAAK